jgi:hypothetical protein
MLKRPPTRPDELSKTLGAFLLLLEEKAGMREYVKQKLQLLARLATIQFNLSENTRHSRMTFTQRAARLSQPHFSNRQNIL